MTFQPTSRYYATEIASFETKDGKQIRYLRRRFLPPLDSFTPLHDYVVVEGDRLDNITSQQLGDPEQFWRICDANPIMRPETLEQIGRHIHITLPEGIPGTPNA